MRRISRLPAPSVIAPTPGFSTSDLDAAAAPEQAPYRCLTPRGYEEADDNLPDILQLVVGAVVIIGLVFVVNAPEFLANGPTTSGASRAAGRPASRDRAQAGDRRSGQCGPRAGGRFHTPGRLRR